MESVPLRGIFLFQRALWPDGMPFDACFTAARPI